ncbi:MAG: DUF6265 family protein [Bacteroidia bacterium]
MRRSVPYSTFVFAVGFYLLLAGCSSKGRRTGLERLEGTWKLTTEAQYERWIKNSDGSFSATVFSPNGKDSTVSEQVKIYKKGESWCFETVVTGENKGKPVVFTSTLLNDSVVQFENPAHDFPTMINYRLLSDNRLRAFIAGKTDTIYFNYTRYNSGQ